MLDSAEVPLLPFRPVLSTNQQGVAHATCCSESILVAVSQINPEPQSLPVRTPGFHLRSAKSSVWSIYEGRCWFQLQR